MGAHTVGNFKVGALILAVFGLLLYFLVNVYHVLMWPIEFWNAPPWARIAYIVIVPTCIGYCATHHALRKLLQKITTRSKMLSVIMDFFPADLKHKTFPEVTMDGWYGLVTARWREDPGIVICNVFIPHTPMTFSGGNVRRVPESQLTYTGLTATIAITRYTSYGMHNPDIPENRRIT